MTRTGRAVRRAGIGVLAALMMIPPAFAQNATPGPNTIVIRGERQEVHYFPAEGTRIAQRVLFLPGVGGWRGWAVTVAKIMASWGYDVYGLDTKTYLDGFTGATSLTPDDVMTDMRQIADWAVSGSGEPLTFVGWSEGAGLGVLGAAAEPNKHTFNGLITFGLSDQNAIAWHWTDNLASLVKKPKEPSFSAAQYMVKIAPLPLWMIQSGHDQYTSLDEANRLFGLAQEPKRFVLVQAENHRFDGNHDEFFAKLHEGLQWVSQSR